MLLFAGELVAAASLVEEVQVVTEATGSRIAPYGALCLAALRGREAEFSALATATKDEVVQRGEGIVIGLTDWATAVLDNGLGHYQNAMAAAETASAYLANVSAPRTGLWSSWSRRPPAAGRPSAPPTPYGGCRSPPVPAAAIGRSGSRRVHGHC